MPVGERRAYYAFGTCLAPVELPYRWAWSKWPTDSWGEPGHRKGQRCRVLARGRNGNVLVEFADGHRVVTLGWGLRRVEEVASA